MTLFVVEWQKMNNRIDTGDKIKTPRAPNSRSRAQKAKSQNPGSQNLDLQSELDDLRRRLQEAEEALHNTQNVLELKVQERTAQLEAVHAQLISEITARKSAEGALRMSREMLQTVINHMPVAVSFIRGSDLRLQLVNPDYQAIAPGKEMVGRTLDELWPETGQDFTSICRRVLETGEPHQVVDELNMVRRGPDGPPEPAYFSWSLHRVQMPGEDGWGLLNTAWETTFRKQAETALGQSLARLDWVREKTGIGTWLNELPFGHLNWDEQTRRLFFVPPEAEPTIDLFWSRIHPEDQERTRLAVEKAIRDHTLYDIDHRAVNPDTGEVRWIRSIGQVTYATDGTPARFDGINFDITARKRVEEALRQSQMDLDRAQEVGAIGWWRLDTRQNVLTWSDENHRIFGIPKGTPLSYEAFLNAVHPDDREYVDRMWKDGMQGAPYEIEHRIVVENRIKWVREKAYSEFTEDGTLLGGFGITQDITDRKLAEEELRCAKEELELHVAERTAELVQSNRQLEEEIAERIEAEKHLTAMNSLLKLFSGTFRRKGYLEAVVKLVKSWCDCDCIGIRLIDEQGNMPYGASLGFSSELLAREDRIALTEQACACSRIAEKQTNTFDAAHITSAGSFVCNDSTRMKTLSADGRMEQYLGICIREGFLSLAVIPIFYREKVLGVIHLADSRPGQFSAQHIELVESATPLIGEALHRFNIEEALVSSRERLRNLTGHLQAAGEAERIKIAREIHDELGQALTAAGIELSRLKSKGRLPKTVKAVLESISGLLDGAVEDVHQICSELRPRILDHLGLNAAVEWQAKNFSDRTGIKCSCTLVPLERELPGDITTALFRIVQETLTNAARHAECSEVAIRLEMEDRTLVLTIEDDGKGATTQNLQSDESYGVLGIRERAHGLGGTMNISSEKGRGTTVSVRIPLFTKRAGE